MGRVEETFAKLRSEGKKALVAYLCVGFPSVEESTALAIEAAKAGADLLELGVPFSDPIADGPVIARASAKAIAAGGSLKKALAAAKAIRAEVATPIVLFGYFNPIFTYGPTKLVADAKAAAVDALLVVDLPPEEGADLRDAAEREGVSVVPLLTPTSDESRVAAALRRASGFVYYVSVTGVTGAAEAPLDEASKAAAKLRERSGLPVVVGFGIDSGDKARRAAGEKGSGADGVVVGTALVRAIEDAKDAGARRAAVRKLVASLRSALDA